MRVRMRDHAGRSEPRPGRSIAGAAVLALLLVGGGIAGGGGAVARQQGTPVANGEATPPGASPVATETAPDLGSPYAQVIAQGLIFLEGGAGVWRVREITPAPAEEAAPEEGRPFALVLQRSGVTVVRNDLTQRRARIEAGEAAFASALDPYTRSAEGDGASRAWVIELVPPDAEAEDDDLFGQVFFTSDQIAELPSGVYDLELVRNALQQGDSATLPDGTTQSLLLVTTGTVETSAGGTLQARGGALVDGSVSVSNTQAQTAVYVVATIGARVLDPGEVLNEETPAGTPEGEPATEDTPAPDPAGDPDQDGLTNAEEAELGTDGLSVDTDGDGLADPDEIVTGTDPTAPDTDADGLGDLDELNAATGPLNPDTDADGFTDGDEVSVGTDPNDPGSFPQ